MSEEVKPAVKQTPPQFIPQVQGQKSHNTPDLGRPACYRNHWVVQSLRDPSPDCKRSASRLQARDCYHRSCRRASRIQTGSLTDERLSFSIKLWAGQLNACCTLLPWNRLLDTISWPAQSLNGNADISFAKRVSLKYLSAFPRRSFWHLASRYSLASRPEHSLVF